MQILIKFNGKFYCFLSRNESIMAKISSKTGLNLRNIKIMKCGNLIDFDTVGFVAGVNDVFDILIKRELMKIEANLPDGNIIYVVLSKFRKIIDIKLYIEKKINIPFNNIALVYNYVNLRDDKSLEDCFGEVNEPKIVVREKCDISVNVTCHKRGYNDETLILRIRSNDTVRRLKEIINDKCLFDIPPYYQELCYRTKMRDEYTVVAYNIEDGSRLTAIFVKSITICIKDMGGCRYNLIMDCYDTVHMVEDKLKIEYGIKKIDNIKLLFRGDELENERTLMDCGIDDGDILTCGELLGSGFMGVPFSRRNGSTRRCRRGMASGVEISAYVGHMDLTTSLNYISSPDRRITMRPTEGDTFVIDISWLWRVKDVREVIERRNGYRRDIHDLMVDGESLVDDNASAMPYINKIIDIIPYKRVKFQIIDNDVFTDLDIDYNMSVADIKKLIFQDIGLFEGIQQLYLDGTLLNDNDTVLSSPLAQGTETKRIECKLLITDEV